MEGEFCLYIATARDYISMGFFNSNKKGIPPHTWYPDILHWKEGDEIYCWAIMSAIGWKNFSWANYHKYVDPYTLTSKCTFYYKSIDEQGTIFLDDGDGTIAQFEFWRLIRKARNESFTKRQIEYRVKQSEGYMELMEEFQKAFNELQESDLYPRGLGERTDL